IGHLGERGRAIAKQRRDARERWSARDIETGAFKKWTQSVAQLGIAKSLDVLMVDPTQLIGIEARRRRMNMPNIEPLDQLLPRRSCTSVCHPIAQSPDRRARRWRSRCVP